ncbi:MAG TPA: glycine--tRNA ligase [Dehalococcoidia bacterium]|nr:glycine--tRNA ligase [Dehalococcoidia bacterium]
MDTIVSLAKRRGFVFPSSEIYGGFASTWDYGPLGVELKRNVKDAWWTSMVRDRRDIVGLDAAILMAPKVWETSGHVQNFHDPLVDCRECKMRFREDHLAEQGYLPDKICPSCGAVESMTDTRQFNLMFKTFVGPVEEDAATAYLRPETAQGIFVNFENVLTTTRRRLPFGIAQQGKSFRNEITPGNFIFRTREFEQMEMEFFVHPDEADDWYRRWVDLREQWFVDLGVRPENIRRDVHAAEKLSHYSAGTTDLQYHFPWGWDELEGIANRTNFDLGVHAEASGRKLTYFDNETNEHVVPYVVEPALGVDRAMLVFLLDAYHSEPDEKGDDRVLLKFHPRIAPVKVAVLPLSRKEPVANLAGEVWDALRPHWFTQYDDTQSIGRRYRRQDEIGTPLCVTVDFDSLDDNAATIRERDTQEQIRVPIPELPAAIREKLGF